MIADPLPADEPREVYRLGVDERLSVKVLAWSETERRFDIWPAVSGEYRIQADGMILVPLAGQIVAAGLTTAELSAQIGKALQSSLGSLEPPAAAVEVVEYRPFYIVGDVAQPGAFPARPGLLVAQAVALAGGTGSAFDPGAQDSRTVLNDTEGLRSVLLDLARFNARKARLEAERNDISSADEIAFPTNLYHPDGADALTALITEEKAVFDARAQAFQLQASTLTDLQALLRTEITNLQARLKGQGEQVRLAREALDSVATLAERGLAANAPLANAQRQLIETEGRELDMQTGLYRAQQQEKEATRDMIELQTQRQTQVTSELQQTNARIEALNGRRALLRQFLEDAGAQVDTPLMPESIITYDVLREGATESVPVEATARVGPGDIVTVTRVLLEQSVEPPVPSPASETATPASDSESGAPG